MTRYTSHSEPVLLREPRWHAAQKCHDWRNHIGERVRVLWDTFTDDQRVAIASDAEDRANAEEWD